MTVAELVVELLKLDQTMRVSVSVGGPKDTAYTDDIVSVGETDGEVEIRGWAASDNENAYLPGAD